MSLSQVWKLADKFAQQVSAQPEQITHALQRARLTGTPSLVSPLLERAQVPGHTQADIKLTVNPGPTATLNSTLTPHHEEANQTLTQLLNSRFGNLITQALQQAKLNVVNPISLDWLQITRLSQ